MTNQVITWVVAGAITILIAIFGVFTPKLFAFIKTKIGTNNFTKFLSFASYAAVNVANWFKANKGAQITAQEVYNEFVAEITVLCPYVTVAQINNLFYHIVSDLAKELGIDISEFSAEKLGIEKKSTTMLEVKPLF